MTLLRTSLLLALTLLSACFALLPSPLRAATATSRGAAQDMADIDHLLTRAKPGSDSVFVGDMGFKVDALQGYRARLAARLAGRLAPRSSFLPAVTPWPGGNVPYAFDSTVSAANQSAFVQACHDWEQVANVHFTPRTTETNYVLVHSQQYNNSYVGMIGGPQDINLYNFNYEFIIAHEIGHALGLIHEHERSDRDTYITVNRTNVTSGMESNFDIVPGSLNQGNYDFDSVMHYGPTAFSSNGQPTMAVNAPYAAQYGNAIGQFTHLSVSDKAGMAAIYGPPGSVAPPVPVAPPAPVLPASRVLWTLADGTASLWNMDAAGGFTYTLYGPFPGWSPCSLASSADGKAHLLWNHTSGAVSLWTITATGGYAHVEYGPFPGWTAKAIAAGPDNLPRILWTTSNGMISLWSVDGSGGVTHSEYGPFPGWTGQSLSVGPDGQAQVLWDCVTGMISLWTVSAAGSYTHAEYGPFSRWTARSLTVGPDGLRHLLWNSPDGTACLWAVNAAGSSACAFYGPYPGWTANSVSVGSDNALHVLWSAPGGWASLWTAGSAGSFSHREYGPFGSWQAIGMAGK